MSKRLRIFSIVCAIIVVVGLLLAGIGWMLGGTADLSLGRHFRFAGGMAKFSGDIQVQTVSTEAFDRISLNVGYYGIQLIEGDAYRVEYSYDKGIGKPSVQVENGTLTIFDKFSEEGLNFNLIGINKIPRQSQNIYMRVYYPKGTELSLIEVESALGNLKIADTAVKELSVVLDLGDMEIERVKAQSAELDINLGELTAKEFETYELDASLDLGTADVTGIFRGQTKISCDLGDINMVVQGDRAEYGFNAEVDLGDFHLDGKRLGTPYESELQAANVIEANCNLGNIDIDFR